MTNHPGRNRKNRARRASAELRQLTVPEGLSFADLKLSQSADGVSFDTAAINRLCAANGLDPATFLRTDEGNVASLIVGWYAAHLANGGAPDATADNLVNEALADDQDHMPGMA